MTSPDRSAYTRFYCKGISAFDRQQWPLAIDLLAKAVKGLHWFDTHVEFKEAHYCLAIAFETIGNIQAAEKHYIEVLRIDYVYKDALARLERIRPS